MCVDFFLNMSLSDPAFPIDSNNGYNRRSSLTNLLMSHRMRRQQTSGEQHQDTNSKDTYNSNAGRQWQGEQGPGVHNRDRNSTHTRSTQNRRSGTNPRTNAVLSKVDELVRVPTDGNPDKPRFSRSSSTRKPLASGMLDAWTGDSMGANDATSFPRRRDHRAPKQENGDGAKADQGPAHRRASVRQVDSQSTRKARGKGKGKAKKSKNANSDDAVVEVDEPYMGPIPPSPTLAPSFVNLQMAFLHGGTLKRGSAPKFVQSAFSKPESTSKSMINEKSKMGGALDPLRTDDYSSYCVPIPKYDGGAPHAVAHLGVIEHAHYTISRHPDIALVNRKEFMDVVKAVAQRDDAKRTTTRVPHV